MKSKEIYLSEEQKAYLKKIVKSGVHNSHEIIRARVLLMLDRNVVYTSEAERGIRCTYGRRT